MPIDAIKFAVRGTLMHTPQRGELEILADALLTVAKDGNISAVLLPQHSGYAELCGMLAQVGKLQQLDDGHYLLPGLVDLHNHAPQWPQMGKALDLPLADWLQNYTFPLEAKYADLAFAEQVYCSLVDTLLANGTTTALYFATVHLEASKVLADICLAKGQRALVGKVAMDDASQCPEFYRDHSAQQGIDDTRAFIEYVRALPGNEGQRIQPVVTPRFIPSCSHEMLEGLAALVSEYDCHVQSHCSESDWAHHYGIARYGQTDTETFRALGLLTRKTVLAHANFTSVQDRATIAAQGAAIAHCPLSNMYLSSAVLPLREVLDEGLHCGLGTDVSGGPSPSIFNSCANAVSVSRLREAGCNAHLPADRRGEADTRIDIKEAFWMATAGGGQALDIRVGQFTPGYAFDALLINTTKPDSNLIVWPELDSTEEVLQKIIYNAGREHIDRVWVQGELVRGA